jgi:PTEN phosphatase family protein
MDASENNTIAIHCKGGKGRTGTMICIWLLESKACTTAKVNSLSFREYIFI